MVKSIYTANGPEILSHVLMTVAGLGFTADGRASLLQAVRNQVPATSFMFKHKGEIDLRTSRVKHMRVNIYEYKTGSPLRRKTKFHLGTSYSQVLSLSWSSLTFALWFQQPSVLLAMERHVSMSLHPRRPTVDC